ncbi:Trypsin-like peptidase domain-containing protein [Bradyrhizobium brasilense]|uniref:Trypsin-like peptidase domain-containing protein n=2 Tax=Bradyrhizobium brasilense TaxID=1419277 RepID=A0A1G6RXK0_9BRAD|nr:Trypsin-like peptidase domain-containing protein [Bradyrhizobium brasilense]
MSRVRAAVEDSGTLAKSATSGGTLPAATDAAQRALEVGKLALTTIFDEGREQISAEQMLGLEAIVVSIGRPAILIRSDRFDSPPDPWGILERYRAAIEAIFPSVGRIELTGHPSLDWVGTGFMVAPGVLATNRHVIQEFAQPNAQGKWTIEPGISARVDFAEEIDTMAPRERAIGSIIAVHSVFDVALLEVAEGAQGAVPPIRMDGGSVPVGRGRLSFVVGYPALDSRRNDPTLMQNIFANIYNVKRLQPGLLNNWSAANSAYLHDCSTLGGNSGSCFVDLDTGVVTGVHFGGRFQEGNWAVSTRDLAADGYLSRLGARFV